MTENAGERLFQAIGQIPDEMILEASKEHIKLNETGEHAYRPQSDKVRRESEDFSVDTSTGNRLPYRKKVMEKLGGYLKYLPVAACLCIVLGSAGYIINNYMQTDSSQSINKDGSFDSGADEKSSEQNEAAYASGTDMAMDEDVQEEGDGNVQDSVSSEQKEMLPVRYDTYAGPVFPLTATGDTQQLKVSRRLLGVAGTQNAENGSCPLLKVKDVYKIQNTSNHDKTLQIVYPFVSALNHSFETEDEILQVTGENSTSVAYSIGESINAYRNADLTEPASMDAYMQIFNEQTDYQELALAKEADWNKNVHVYTFSNIRMQEEAMHGTQQGVIGVTIKDSGADVLTYGFDHSFTKEDGSTNYCFFASQEQKKRMLIVTGDQAGEPQPGYYTNLDCEEKIEGLQYEMSSQEMSYTDALRLCSNDAARKVRQDYEQGLSAAKLPIYMNEDAAYRVLTMISEEEWFYDTLMQRYQSSELTEIFERLFAETRVIYARTTVTIPARQSVQVTVRTQKSQDEAKDLLTEVDRGGDVTYDFFSSTQSHLPIEKTSVLLRLEEPWQLTEQNMGLRKKKKHTWKVSALKQAGFVTVSTAENEQ